jgi:3-keto-5-aminohexanoate cleavage enzyme
MTGPVIVELAVNGATPRHRNRHVPRTPAEITAAALAGIESGASIARARQIPGVPVSQPRA